VERALTVVVLCNIDICEAGRIAHRVAGLVDPVLELPDPARPGPDARPERTKRFADVLAAWAQGQAHASMAPALAAFPDKSPRVAAMRRQVQAPLAQPHAFHYLAEDDVSTRAIERRGGRVAQVAHFGLVASGDAQALRFYLDEAGRVLDINLEGW
jgi:hypothetical protein